ncbi:MAG: ATP-binding cassette domain-containing protein [Cohaesibacter sp.]|nr:ATP-binding cassette domain-containing protein [Cohaesibacter sp.]
MPAMNGSDFMDERSEPHTILTVKDLQVRGENDRLLLDVPQLKIFHGQTIAIKGASGAGKSTLLFALAGLAEHMSGSICWSLPQATDTKQRSSKAQDVIKLSSEARARFRRETLGMIFQDFLLFEEMDALANATISNGYMPRHNKKAVQQRAEQTLRHLGIKDIAKRTIASFSGGERQRVAIARALANDPPILLADEPTASLDRKASDHLIEDLTALVRAQQKTMIVVSHDMSLCEKMDRILEVTDGQITERNDRQKQGKEEAGS